MPKRTRALSGAAKDAYFRRVLKTYSGLPANQREELVRRLRREIAQLRLRVEQPDGMAAALAAPAPEQPLNPAPAFDPFSPNVIVVLRQGGRAAALTALDAIDNLEDLRLLAREQRLSVSTELSSPPELRAAIVAAAERRVANRLAAAS